MSERPNIYLITYTNICIIRNCCANIFKTHEKKRRKIQLTYIDVPIAKVDEENTILCANGCLKARSNEMK